MDEATAIMRAIEHHTNTLRQFRGSDQARLLVGLLNALIEAYRSDLADVAPEGLVRVQTALRQCVALRDALTLEHATLPRI